METNSWFICPKTNPSARLRLFCFPYAGGGVPVFRGWANTLPPNLEVYAVQLPGRGTRLQETPISQFPPLIQALAEAIHPYLDKPAAFFGHSLGASIAFELARELRRRKDPLPAGLFVAGHAAPQIPDPHPPLHALPEREFLDGLRRFNGTPQEVLEHEELMQLLLPALRGDFSLHETYLYQSEPPLDCPIFAYGGLQDPRVSRGELEAWREHTSGTFTLHMLPGDHFFLLSAQMNLLPTLARELLQLDVT